MLANAPTQHFFGGETKADRHKDLRGGRRRERRLVDVQKTSGSTHKPQEGEEGRGATQVRVKIKSSRVEPEEIYLHNNRFLLASSKSVQCSTEGIYVL